MGYTTREAIISQIPEEVLKSALADDGTGTEEDGLLDDVILAASDRVEAYIDARYHGLLPLAQPPATVRNACLVFACQMIYDRRRVTPTEAFTKRVEQCEADMEAIKDGTVALTSDLALAPAVKAARLTMRPCWQEGL